MEFHIPYPKKVVKIGDFFTKIADSFGEIYIFKGRTFMLQFLHAVQDIPADGDPIALVIVLAVLLVFTVWVVVDKKKKKTAVVPVAEAEEAPNAVAPGSAGQLKLHNVEPKTAAMLMAIVADKTGKPLNELRFISIKEVE